MLPKVDPVCFRSEADLEKDLLALPPAPKNSGRVLFLVARGENKLRRTFEKVSLQPKMGMPGDEWGRRANRKEGMELAVMQHDVASLLANGQPLTLFGDNLFLDLDLSKANLPAGSRLKIGEALVEVTSDAHDGCRKFKDRFGKGARDLVNKPPLRHLNLRGIYFRVLNGGSVAVGDTIEVLSRGINSGTPLQQIVE